MFGSEQRPSVSWVYETGSKCDSDPDTKFTSAFKELDPIPQFKPHPGWESSWKRDSPSRFNLRGGGGQGAPLVEILSRLRTVCCQDSTVGRRLGT
jgi:hypothetical protein